MIDAANIAVLSPRYDLPSPRSIRANNLVKHLVDKYQIERHPNQVGFNRCGTISWLYLEDSKNEYFFTVE